MIRAMGNTVTVNYHGLPNYLRPEACQLARRKFSMTLSDLMRGKLHFNLSPRHPQTDRRTITGFVHPWTATD